MKRSNIGQIFGYVHQTSTHQKCVDASLTVIFDPRVGKGLIALAVSFGKVLFLRQRAFTGTKMKQNRAMAPKPSWHEGHLWGLDEEVVAMVICYFIKVILLSNGIDRLMMDGGEEDNKVMLVWRQEKKRRQKYMLGPKHKSRSEKE